MTFMYEYDYNWWDFFEALNQFCDMLRKFIMGEEDEE